MKILIDPISTNDPPFCSAHYKMQLLMKYALDQREDLFFYYMIPDPERSHGSFQDDDGWLLQHPRVRYLPYATDSDRMREYARVPPDLEQAVAFNGPYWDWDVIITGRSTQVPTLRTWMTRSGRSWQRGAIIEDEFPIMSFKSRVNQAFPWSQDLQALNGYLASDKTLMFSMSSKEQILKTAREWLAPSKVRALDERITPCVPRMFDNLQTKPWDYVNKVATGDKPLTVGYTQRLSGIVERKDDVLDTFLRLYAKEGNRIRLIVTSNSRVVDRYQNHPQFGHVQIHRAPRDEFWRIMREEADVVLTASPDEDYPLSLIEPVTLGVPLIALDAPYVRPTFGKDYPFIVSNAKQMYGMVKAFMSDYAGMYETFTTWFDNWFRPEMARRNDLWFPLIVLDFLDRFQDSRRQKMLGNDNRVVSQILGWVAEKGCSEFTFDEVLSDLDARNEISHLYDTFKKHYLQKSFSLSPNFNDYRVPLIEKHGWEDASTTVGHLRKVQNYL